MVQHWMSWCRLCAREDPNKTHIDVLLENTEGLPLTSTIAQCFSIDINSFSNLPNKICFECYRLIRTAIDLNERITKVSVMFEELHVTYNDNKEAEFDSHIIKARHNLEYDIEVFATNYPSLEHPNDLETKDTIPGIDEQMIDQEMVNCDNIIDAEPIKIKIEADEEVESNCDENVYSQSPSEESSDSSSADTERRTVAVKKRPKRRYRTKKQREAEDLNKPFCCPECKKGFLKIHNYRRHMQFAHDITLDLEPQRFICEHCDKEYKTSSALKEHLRSHTEERTLQCRYCDKKFKGNPTLKHHEETHNNKKYICDICGLKLNTQQTLRMHMVVHSDQKKYKCDHCGNEFKRAKALKNHLILHTGLKPYSCDFCDKTFASGPNCRSHRKKSHPVEFAKQEAAGKQYTAKAKIPTLSELKTVTPVIAMVSKSSDHRKEESGSRSSKSRVDRDKLLDSSSSLDCDKPSSDFCHGIFDKNLFY